MGITGYDNASLEICTAALVQQGPDHTLISASSQIVFLSSSLFTGIQLEQGFSGFQNDPTAQPFLVDVRFNGSNFQDRIHQQDHYKVHQDLGKVTPAKSYLVRLRLCLPSRSCKPASRNIPLSSSYTWQGAILRPGIRNQNKSV